MRHCVLLSPFWLDGPPLGFATAVLRATRQSNTPPLFPAFAQLVINTETFPNSGASTVMLEISPVDESISNQLRLWAFVTATDNEDQSVRVITPR